MLFIVIYAICWSSMVLHFVSRCIKLVKDAVSPLLSKKTPPHPDDKSDYSCQHGCMHYFFKSVSSFSARWSYPYIWSWANQDWEKVRAID